MWVCSETPSEEAAVLDGAAEVLGMDASGSDERGHSDFHLRPPTSCFPWVFVTNR